MGGEEGEERESPLIPSVSDPAEGPFKRTGTIWTAMAHIITGVIGAGVLSLAWSTAQLGWVAGPLTIVVFAATTIFSANLLCDCYRSPDPECGPGRNRSYVEAVQLYLGEKRRRICGVFLQESLYGGGIAYTITSAVSARAIQKSNCYHKEGHKASCQYGDTTYMLLFGAVQIVVSQIPDFHNMAWLSIVATIMSFSYSFIGLGLGIAKVIENGVIKGSVGGVSADSIADKLWLDTLKSPPPENQNMKKASTGAIFIATFFYLCCGGFGYAAFGSDTPGNLLTGFGFYEPYWLIDFANACIVVHLVGGYQAMGVEARDHQTPLVESSFSASSIQPIKRTGVLWTAVAHIITGVIGSGVLSLAWSVAQLGWIAGPLTMLIFASITIVSAFSLCNCYRSPDPLCGPTRNTSYLAAVRMILGKRSAVVSSSFLRINYCKVAIVYTITAATSIRAILKSNCYHREGHQAACDYGYTSYMLFFGFVQLVMSQIPNFRDTEWLSIVASIMSFSYSIIGSALGLAKVIGDGSIKGSIGGVPTSTAPQKAWLVSQAIGDIAFAFPFSVILIEIQDTLKSPPPEKVTMKKASATAISITTFFYLCCGGFGYAAFGNSAPGNLLTGFGFYEPYWLIDFANACIILHLVGGYQVFSQPLFADLEKLIAEKFPNSEFIHENYVLKAPRLPAFRLNFLRLCFRTVYVAFITGIAIAFPYFNQVVGVAGSLTFWPLVIYFPVEMYIAQMNIRAWTRKWIALRVFTIVCLMVALFALVGSIEGLIKARFG
ncbi:hypothetical protein RHGRI_018819 [Rhododendron griersonianum]|uniref:Amino acid transporter transmembrane domain-containing protein n=1 Tax=Rhododendron griersonianum TaxID=479676 RepID=A0AAV6K2V1_9ERIC|nr:hypothetical protein RHGRI_018819 [Rhododendron griersonianum]